MALLLRIPLFGTPFWRTNDTMEYINVARNLDRDRGLTLSVKFILSDQTPVVTSALRSRPPLTSLILAGLLKIRDDPYFLQAFNLFLGIVNAVLVFYLSRSFAAGLLAATNPNILINSRLILSDQLFGTLALLVVLVRKNVVLVGVTMALLALTRLEGALMLVPLTIFFWKKPKQILLMFASFLLIMLPYFLVNNQANGSPLFSKNTIHYQVWDVREALEGGFGRTFPSPATFISQNFLGVVIKIADTAKLHLQSLLYFDYFGPLAILLYFALRFSWRKYLPWLIFCLLVLLLYSSLWSATFERSRHFIFIFLLLLIPLGQFIEKSWKRPLVFLTLAFVFVSYLGFDIHRISWARDVDPTVSVWDQADKKQIYEWLRTQTSPSAIIASTNPFMINLQTDRPTVALPTNLTAENLPRYLSAFKVSYVLLLDGDQLDYLFGSFPLAVSFSNARIYQVGP